MSSQWIYGKMNSEPSYHFTGAGNPNSCVKEMNERFAKECMKPKYDDFFREYQRAVVDESLKMAKLPYLDAEK